MSERITKDRIRQDYEDAAAHRKGRVIRIWVEITDDYGKTVKYAAKPVCREDSIKAYTLAKYLPSGKLDTRYVVRCDHDGCTHCDCPHGRTGGFCKHRAGLTKIGMLDNDLLREVQEEKLHLEYDRQLLAGRLEALVRERQELVRSPGDSLGHTRPGGFCL